MYLTLPKSSNGLKHDEVLLHTHCFQKENKAYEQESNCKQYKKTFRLSPHLLYNNKSCNIVKWVFERHLTKIL